MEVDTHSIDGVKESDDGEQLHTGALWPDAPLGPRRSTDGHQLCELCGKQLSKVKHHRPHGVGRSCKQHDTASRRSASAPHITIPRTKRPYDSLQPTQKRERRKQLRLAIANAEEHLGCSINTISPPSTPSPADLIHLPTSTREQIRTVCNLHIPSEKRIIQCKQQLTHTHATETGTFAGGAYLTDPLRFVSVLCAQSSFIAVGGDAGGGRCTLGVTYTHQSIQHFAALLVYEGGDSWLELQDCRAEGLTPFIGDSSHFSHIWSVLQHLIDTRAAFLNGDWCFLNAVLGLMAPAATHPCPICIVSKSNLLGTSHYRTSNDKHSVDRTHSPLLAIAPERIVPTPLHLFLGISNRIILDAFSELFSKELVEETLKTVTTIHSAGCGGKSDLFDLNGPEIRKWIKRDCSNTLRAAAENKEILAADQKSTHSTLKRWLENLHDHLLHKKDWESKEIDAWRSAVRDIHSNWRAETSIHAFPKLHMLHHTIDFAERHRFLGRVSEAQIESHHAQFNTLFHKQHRNQSGNLEERLRRSLADACLRAVQPFVNQ